VDMGGESPHQTLWRDGNSPNHHDDGTDGISGYITPVYRRGYPS